MLNVGRRMNPQSYRSAWRTDKGLYVAYALEPILWRLPMSDDEVGRVRFGKALGLLNDEGARFIRRLSSLRNVVAHRIENVNFDLQGCASTPPFPVDA
jgi:hypothetical protein